MTHYYIYANNEFKEVTESKIFSDEEEFSFLVEIETLVTDENSTSYMYIMNDIIASNEVDISNISDVLDLAQMFHVDDTHERVSQTFKIELSQY